MGCCLTTPAAGDDSKTNSKPPPPPGFEEEETVKQVLSETPITSKKPPLTNSISSPIQITEEELIKNPVEENPSEVSSEVYTYSASISVATTTTTIGTRTEIEIDEDGEVTQKVNKPLPEKIVSSRRKERGTRPPPPARKNQLPSRNITSAQRHRNVVPSNVTRLEPPARRLRSPATRQETKQAGQLRKTKGSSSVRNSGNRIPVKMTENKDNVKLKNATNDADVTPVPVPVPETGESLENPLVSLECFIFL